MKITAAPGKICPAAKICQSLCRAAGQARGGAGAAPEVGSGFRAPCLLWASVPPASQKKTKTGGIFLKAQKEGLREENVMVREMRINLSTTPKLVSLFFPSPLHPSPLCNGAGTPPLLNPQYFLSALPSSTQTHTGMGTEGKLQFQEMLCSESHCSHCKDQPHESGIPRTGLS